MLLAAGLNSGLYKFMLLLHITSVVVGIGAVMLNGLYAREAMKRPGPTGRAVSEANFAVSKVAEYVIYSIPIWGFALIGLSDKAWKFSQTWIWLSLLLYVVALGISHGVMVPGTKRMHVLMEEAERAPAGGGAPPEVAEMQQIGQRLAAGGAALNILTVILIALMIWKPGA